MGDTEVDVNSCAVNASVISNYGYGIRSAMTELPQIVRVVRLMRSDCPLVWMMLGRGTFRIDHEDPVGARHEVGVEV